ncbi:hypothetical protein RCO28_34415 [Streptomyces sp. LHD-70]|uniref:hypothetical protein n=1 Tax=Streptomyces sp. LHD-70 TaxID=3072140 RepID=UPI00280CDDA3|nr:hypothetical protein [Streptomyces sp. LHD-70]MDQ8707527.1 hypothetical protein [Streptomyces sp. LHD-70]
MIRDGLQRRFDHYQVLKRRASGTTPSNAVVVRRAFLHARREELFSKLLRQVQERQQPTMDEEDHDEDGLFDVVPARRPELGRTKHTRQQSFRPSRQELALYDSFCTWYGFPNRSDFLDAVLDAFLPQLPKGNGRS